MHKNAGSFLYAGNKFKRPLYPRQAEGEDSGNFPAFEGSGIHKDLRKGFVNASDLTWKFEDSFMEHACIMRFPLEIARLLRRRLEVAFRVDVLGETNLRSDLGLDITPTPKEDYRLFNVSLKLYNEDDVQIVNSKKPRINSAAPETLKLQGLLQELPLPIEAYKSPDLNSLVKSTDISQILIVFYPEDAEDLGIVLNQGKKLHDCEHTAMNFVDSNSFADVHFTQTDLERKCPWEHQSGLVPPTYLARERRLRDFSIYSKTQMQIAEEELLALMKNHTQELVQLELVCPLEAYLQQEALRPNSKLSQKSLVLKSTGGVPEYRQGLIQSQLVGVVTLESDELDNPADDLSDRLFDGGEIRSVWGGSDSPVGKRGKGRGRHAAQKLGSGEAAGTDPLAAASLGEELQSLAAMDVADAAAEDDDDEDLFHHAAATWEDDDVEDGGFDSSQMEDDLLSGLNFSKK